VDSGSGRVRERCVTAERQQGGLLRPEWRQQRMPKGVDTAVDAVQEAAPDASVDLLLRQAGFYELRASDEPALASAMET
jgi:uncharacterized glyoxalase superfamily metalloenzyme YdcJ